ncbi:hypothetical protein ACNRWW_07380 [Metabacillus sp. HB246100]|nr:hypothetical protein [Bacillus weihaiensis]
MDKKERGSLGDHLKQKDEKFDEELANMEKDIAELKHNLLDKNKNK